MEWNVMECNGIERKASCISDEGNFDSRSPNVLFAELYNGDIEEQLCLDCLTNSWD
jgi:hypothetical protein